MKSQRGGDAGIVIPADESAYSPLGVNGWA